MKTLGLLDATISISDSCLGNWMELYFPDTAISPHLSDYCPACFTFTTSIDSLFIQMRMLKV